ncbi:MAG: DEAD/DEAH box helicase family protein [Treponema sp.]|nr:DEAD/DEAH box helicase family protein [Treponema sp.]
MLTEKRLSEAVCKEYKQIIQNNDDNEVFVIGQLASNGIVDSIKVCSRGNKYAVPLTMESKNASVLIHNHPSGNLTPSNEDLLIASKAAENAQGFYIVNNSVTKIYVVVEPILPKKLKKLNCTAIGEYLSYGGPLAKLSENFEERESQINLAKFIAESFNKNLVGIFEAGTGVGKSFAYLIPSIIWAVKNKERVIISTGTINLQQQLVEKDIPLAEKISGKKIKAVLMKGRQNYICKRRLNDAATDRELFNDDVEQFESIIEWSKTTSTGSRSDLSFLPQESVWSRVNSEADMCMGMRCVYHDSCYVMQLRKEAASANLIVVNHHLLFADLEARLEGVGYDDTAVLPPFNRIIFDEAHGMENAATSFFSAQLNRFKILKQINLLYRVRRGSVAGHLITFEALSSRKDKAESVMVVFESLNSHLAEMEDEALLLMSEEFTWRLCDKTAKDASALLTLMNTIHEDIAKFVGAFRSIITGIAEKDEEHPAVWETKHILNRLENAGNVCQWFTEWSERNDTIFWIDKVRYNGKSGSGIYPRFYATPLDIAPKMQRGVFEPLNTVICTSATLKTGKSFDYWLYRTGAGFTEKERLVLEEFASPFPYSKNLLLAIPSDIPMPDNPDFQSAIEKALTKLINASCGRTLVLFTSYESLRLACEYARENLVENGIVVLRQGEDDRFRLLETFKKDSSSVLFATDSFWEGVDVPGESLSQVVIVKLPFTVPSDPVFAARSEYITKKGGNPFMDLSVPEAVIKFRQGFGRLMRSSSDRGVVTVLDRRIIEKRYGAIFLSSIPETKILNDSLSSVVNAIERFL